VLDVGTVDASASLEFGQAIRALSITDIDYYEGEIFVAGVSGDDFSSTIRRAAYPFDGTDAVTQTEIWHAVHAQFETRSPIITADIQEIDGVPYMVAVYACTPLVRFALSDLEDGAQVRGDMISELGFGNTPVDIVSYEDPFVQAPAFLVTHTNRSATQFLHADVASAETLPYEPPNVFDRHPGTLQLRTLLLPLVFDRADHIVEMNFPGAPDPFGYGSAPDYGYEP
jgi:hypothetical protein